MAAVIIIESISPQGCENCIILRQPRVVEANNISGVHRRPLQYLGEYACKRAIHHIQ